jgi:hypothetical protein
MYNFFCTALFLTFAITSFAQKQDELFSPGQTIEPKHGFILNFNGGVDLPAGDLAKRFGTSYRLGPALSYKTRSNWLFGAKADFIMGNLTFEDSLFVNVRDKYSTQNSKKYEFINGDGERINVAVFERGYAIGLFAGKIISFSKYQPDNGLVLTTTAGFLQHKIKIVDKSNTVSQLRHGYIKGYDRLTNGLFIEQYVGYIYFARNRLLNFSVGADVMVGFTQGRRDYLYDVMRPDNNNRVDVLVGLRGSWFIPIFKRKSEELIFE